MCNQANGQLAKMPVSCAAPATNIDTTPISNTDVEANHDQRTEEANAVTASNFEIDHLRKLVDLITRSSSQRKNSIKDHKCENSSQSNGFTNPPPTRYNRQRRVVIDLL